MVCKPTAFGFFLLVSFCILPAPSTAQQVADSLFEANVAAPAYAEGSGPTVLIDEGHRNFHTMEGRYLPFARLLQQDGYVVKPHHGRLTLTALGHAKILVISNALAKENEDDWNLPTPSAFDSAEIAAVRSRAQVVGQGRPAVRPPDRPEHPLQGTAADIMKKAMIDVWTDLKKSKLSARMVLQVHDELVLEVPVDERSRVEKIVRARMENVCEFKVPLKASLGWGPSWAETK